MTIARRGALGICCAKNIYAAPSTNRTVYNIPFKELVDKALALRKTAEERALNEGSTGRVDIMTMRDISQKNRIVMAKKKEDYRQFTFDLYQDLPRMEESTINTFKELSYWLEVCWQ